jgi:hypothetical protein
MDSNKAPHGTFTQLPNVFIDLCDISDEAYRLFTKLYREYGTRGSTYTGSLRKLAEVLGDQAKTIGGERGPFSQECESERVTSYVLR